MQLVAEMKLSKVEDDIKQVVLVGILLGLSVCAGKECRDCYLTHH